MEVKSVLILGGAERLGRATARAFVEAGWRVMAQVHPTLKPPVLPGVEWIRAEPDDAQALCMAAIDAAVVVLGHTPRFGRAGWTDRSDELTAAAVLVARGLGATLIMPRTVFSLGGSPQGLLREDIGAPADHPYTSASLLGERRLREASEDRRLQGIVVRAGHYFGPGVGGWLPHFVAARMRFGRFTHPGRMEVAVPWAYLPDLARTFVHLAERRHRLPAFSVLHFPGHCVDGHDWGRALAQLAGERGWVPAGDALLHEPMPWGAIRAAGLFSGRLRALGRLRPAWQHSHALDGLRLAQAVGALPHTPFHQAVRESMADTGWGTLPTETTKPSAFAPV